MFSCVCEIVKACCSFIEKNTRSGVCHFGVFAQAETESIGGDSSSEYRHTFVFPASNSIGAICCCHSPVLSVCSDNPPHWMEMGQF